MKKHSVDLSSTDSNGPTNTQTRGSDNSGSALVEQLRFDARWHEVIDSGWRVSTDEMKDSAKLEREAADRIEQLEIAHRRLLSSVDTEGIAVGEDGYCRNWRAEKAEQTVIDLRAALSKALGEQTEE